MRVLNTSNAPYREGTVVRVTKAACEPEGPEYSLVFYDSFWRREAWCHTRCFSIQSMWP